MTEEFIGKMREKLLDEQRFILRDVRLEREEYDELVQNPEPKDTAGAAQFSFQSKIAADLGVADQRRLRQIRAALNNISNQQYGICRNCGREISAERLEAIPYTQLCIDCRHGEEDREETAE